MIGKAYLIAHCARALVLVSVLTCVGTVVIAKPPKDEVQMPMAAPSFERVEVPQTGRPSFSLNATRFKQTVEQNDPQFSTGAPKLDVSAFRDQPLAGGVQSVRLLANYDIELIIDESMSMRKPDCPGGMSRWDWCGMQAGQLAKQLSPFVPNGFTLTTFASGYTVYNNATPGNVMQLFRNPMFSFGTMMVKPLENRLNAFYSRRAADGKPLLIAMITDGCPTPWKRGSMMVANALIDATRRMRHPREITVVFFQIGGADPRGQRFLSYLDTGLVADGARFDIVRNVSMERLQQIGLAQSLVDSIQDLAAQ